MKHKSKTSKWNWKCESKSETILNPKLLLFSSSSHNSVAFCIIAWASYDCAAGEILVIVTIGCNCKIIVRYENYWLSESMSIEPKRREETLVMTAFTTHFVSLVPNDKHFYQKLLSPWKQQHILSEIAKSGLFKKNLYMIENKLTSHISVASTSLSMMPEPRFNAVLIDSMWYNCQPLTFG